MSNKVLSKQLKKKKKKTKFKLQCFNYKIATVSTGIETIQFQATVKTIII